MNNSANYFREVIQEMSLLFEMALATGQSMDLRESCDLFLKRLMDRKDLVYSAVWIKDAYLTGKANQRTATLVYAFPEYLAETKKLSLDHPLFSSISEKEYLAVPAYKEEFWGLVNEKGITNGTFVLFSLDEIGVLKLFSARDNCFSNYELNQLRKVISKFAYSLKGCLSYKQLLTEIAERKKTEEALKQSKQQIADIVNFLPVASFAINLEGKVIAWNHTLEVMTDVKAKDMLGKGNYEYALPFFKKRRPLLIDLVLKPELKDLIKEDFLFFQRFNNNSMVAEIFLPDLKGKQTYLRARTAPLFDPRGRIIGAIESLRDITESKKLEKKLENARIELEEKVKKRTFELYEVNKALRSEIAERKNAEAALAEEKELLTVTLHSIADGVITTDTLGNISSINRMGEKIIGWKQDEVKDKPFASVFQILTDERMLKICDNPLERVLNQNEMTDPIRLLTKNNIRKIISANAAPIRDKKHNTVGYVIIFRDITEQKKVEAQLALSQKLKSIGELAAGIAHEINTLMQYIGDNITFLQRAIKDIVYDLMVDYKQLTNKPEDDKIFESLVRKILKKEEKLGVAYLLEEIPKAFEETLEGIEKIKKIVYAMKDFAHPGKKEMKPADINKAVEVTATISRNEWKYVAELETDLQPGLPLVYCVIDEINQVLLNMIVNAAQAIKEAHITNPLIKGKIAVTTKVDGDNVSISISDNGIGIPKKIMDKIFEPFFTTKEVGKGTGQGLAIAYNIIVNKHKGTIEVDSEEGKGTVFTIRLPINPALRGNKR
ncbi:MAG: PAS domain S-box protein [Firmicutes bacterium]|nr:PAS domain S-box protein [Bacillota bacterium]